jgi:predicted RNA binding protein YcfA (HicA-like mRNA interferase family)
VTLLSSGDVENILRKNGFKFLRQRGSHRQFVGVIEDRKRYVTVPANRKEIAKGTLASIIRQSGLGRKKFFGK